MKFITPSTNFELFSYSLIRIPNINPKIVAIIIDIIDISKCSSKRFTKNSFLSTN